MVPAELPILYSFRRCPYAMRARMAIDVSGVTVVLREIILRDKPADMLVASPKGTVPVLVLPNGDVIDESIDIMRWALAQHDPECWLAGDDPRMITLNDGRFKAALDRYKYPHRYGLPCGIGFRQEGFEILEMLNDELSWQAYLKGSTIGLVDVALFPFIRQFAATDQEWFDTQTLPSLQHWLATMVASPRFAHVMQKRPLWHSDDPETIFP